MHRGLATLAVALAVGVGVACSSNTSTSGVTVSYARVELLDGAGAIMSGVNIVTDGPVGSPVIIVRNVPTRLRVTWFAADSNPDPAAADPSFQAQFAIPPGFGLSFAPSAAARYEGTITGTTLQPSLVFVPLHLFDARRSVSVFSALVPFLVQ